MTIDRLNQDKIEQDTLTLLLHRKEKELSGDTRMNWQNAVRFYGVWGVNGMLGPRKTPDSLCLGRSGEGLTRWLFEHSKGELEGAVGQMHYFYRLEPE